EHARRIVVWRVLQHRGERGAGVLDVDVDLARTQSRVAHEGAAEIELAVDGDARPLENLRHQLPEDALLGEVLRPDDHAVSAAAARRGGDQEQERGGDAHHRGGLRRRSSAPRSESAPRASAAAGRAPARMVRLSTIATPRKMKTPRPPAPMAAAIVARPIPITVASRLPARMTLAP